MQTHDASQSWGSELPQSPSYSHSMAQTRHTKFMSIRQRMIPSMETGGSGRLNTCWRIIYHTTEDKTLVWEGAVFQTRLWKLAPPFKSFPGSSDGKESACNARDPGLIPRLGRSLKRMATHSSIPAWEIPWTKKPGGLQSMGSQRVGHDWVVNTFTLDHLRATCFGEFYLSPISPFVDWRL